MKKTAACLAFISSVLLFTATLVPAAEQKIIFTTKSIEYKSGTGLQRCQDICNKKSVPDATVLLSEGWRIVSSSPKKIIGEQYRYAPCPTCEPHGCFCIGTEYLLEKDLVAPKVVTSNSDLDQLISEKDLLKEEIHLLKQEIKELKKQIKLNQISR